MIRSTDRGASWSASIKVADLLAVGARDPATQLPIRDGSIIPEIAVAPNGQRALIVWQDARFSGGTVDGIALSRSTDGGLTWSTPAQVNSARAVAAFTPSIRVRADGTIGITYYDLRSNTADTDNVADRADTGPLDRYGELDRSPTDTELSISSPPRRPAVTSSATISGLAANGNVFIPVYVRTTGSTTNRTDVFAVFARSIASSAARAATTSVPRTATALTVDEATRQRASDHLGRVMERRIPGWTRWRAETAGPGIER